MVTLSGKVKPTQSFAQGLSSSAFVTVGGAVGTKRMERTSTEL